MDVLDFRINSDVRVAAFAEGPRIRLTFSISGRNDIGPIELTRAEALKAGGDLIKSGSSDAIPLSFTTGAAIRFGRWLMRFAADV
jgi:hypothetical protein